MGEVIGFILALLCLCASVLLAWLAWWLWRYTPTQADWDYWHKKDSNAEFIKTLNRRIKENEHDRT